MALSVVSHQAGADGANPTTNTYGLTVASTGAGNLLVAAILIFDSAHRTVSGVSDGTNAFTQFPSAARVISSGTFDGVTLDIWYLPSSSSGKTTITVTLSGATQFKEMAVWEVSGFTTPVTDGVAGHSDKTGVLTTNTGETVTTTAAAGFLAALCGESNAVITNPKVGNEFSAGGDIRGTDGFCSLISASAAAHTPEWTSNTAASQFCTVTAAFMETPASGASPNMLTLLGVGA